MNLETFTIYGMVSDGKIRYVGSTGGTLENRLRGHRASKSYGKTANLSWRDGTTMICIAKTSARFRLEIEQAVIELLRARGESDLNVLKPLGGRWKNYDRND